jgi:ABC-type glycerol-3-phosphate transport system permease component
MKSSTGAGAVSGCIVWVILIGVLSTCIFPIAITVASVTSFTDMAIQATGPFICPEDTTYEVHTYQTTSTDEYGHESPATGYELYCLDASGNVVHEDPVMFAFLWIGFMAAIALILVAVLAFALAAPAGVLIARLLRSSKPGNIEPS